MVAQTKTAEPTVVNGINVDAKAVENLMTPRMMYLWRGQ